MTTTIAQALRKIKKLKGSIALHSQRARGACSYVKGKEPAFRFQSEMSALQTDKHELLDLEARVARANGLTTLEFKGQPITLAYAIRSLQEIKSQIAFLNLLHLRNEIVEERSNNYVQGNVVTEVKEVTWLSDLSEQERDSQVRALENDFEQLNNLVETANHSTVV